MLVPSPQSTVNWFPLAPSRLKPFRHLSMLLRTDCGPTIVTVWGTPLPSVELARSDRESAIAIPAFANPHAAASTVSRGRISTASQRLPRATPS